MRLHKLQFTSIEKQIKEGINGNSIDTINDGMFKLASFMGVKLGYNNLEEFNEQFDDMELAL